MFFNSTSTDDTTKLAKRLAAKLQPGSVVAFFGDLGAGKTTFIRQLASALAAISPEAVCSPTFQYLNIYKGTTGLPAVYHFDLYRLKNADDFLALGFDEMLNPQGICCIEWAEKIVDILPKNTIRVEIAHAGSDARTIQIHGLTI